MAARNAVSSFRMALLWVAVFILACFDPVSSVDSLERLRKHLLQNYDKHARPEQTVDTNTTVFLKVGPVYLVDYDEDKSLLTLDALIFMKWNDSRLKWDPKNFGGHKHTTFDTGTVWQPEILVYNSHSSNVNPKAISRTIVTSSSTIIWVPPATITAYCHLEDVHLYPHDIQECGITFGTWTENGFELDIQLDEEGIDFTYFRNSNPRWEILHEKSNVSRKENYYDCCVEPYVTLDISFYLQRRYPPHLKVAWIPCVLVMILTLTLFWIPLFSGKKIALGGFLFVAMTIIMAYVAASTKPPAAQIQSVSFVQITLCAVTAAIVLEILVMNLASIGHPYRPPGFLVGILSSTVCKWFLVWSPLQPTESMDQIQLQDGETDKAVTPSFKYEWIMVATAVDRILFIIFLVVFLAIH